MINAPPLLSNTARLSADKVLNPERMRSVFAAASDRPVLIVLAAGKGTRFGTEPKCVQRVGGKPLARHSIDAFQRRYGGPVVCLVHYRQDDVSEAPATATSVPGGNERRPASPAPTVASKVADALLGSRRPSPSVASAAARPSEGVGHVMR